MIPTQIWHYLWTFWRKHFRLKCTKDLYPFRVILWLFSFQVTFSKMFRDIFQQIFCKKEQGPRYLTEGDVTRVTTPYGKQRQSMTQLTPLHGPHEDSPAVTPTQGQKHKKTNSLTQLNPSNTTPVSNGDRITIHDGEQTYVWCVMILFLFFSVQVDCAIITSLYLCCDVGNTETVWIRHDMMSLDVIIHAGMLLYCVIRFCARKSVI